MPKHIGIVACSAEGAALCYRTVCREAAPYMGEHNHPEITLHTIPLAEYMIPIRAGDWRRCADLMLQSAEKVAGCGAEIIICPDNTIHESWPYVVDRSPVPWLHIAECVGREAKRKGYKKLGILGTRYLMTGPVYPDALRPLHIDTAIPNEEDREKINEIIFSRLVYGDIQESDRRQMNDIVDKLKREGCDAAVMGCTEIPLLLNPNDCSLPLLDSTRLLARAALQEALKKDIAL